MVALGSTLAFKARLYDRDPSTPGAIALNPATVTLTVSRNNVVVATPTIVNPPPVTGEFTFNYPTTEPGRHVGRWLFVMGDGASTAYVQVFNVDPADPGIILGLDEAKDHLNIPIENTKDDEEILDWLSAITPIVEFHVGACIPRTVAEMHEVGRVIQLRTTPVVSVQSITPYLATGGATITSADLRVTPEGRLMLYSGEPFPYGPVTVTYTAGRNVVPPNIISAVKIILDHLWSTQRGSSGLPLQGAEDSVLTTGNGYAMPHRALELLRPDDGGPAIG